MITTNLIYNLQWLLNLFTTVSRFTGLRTTSMFTSSGCVTHSLALGSGFSMYNHSVGGRMKNVLATVAKISEKF